MGIYSDSQLGLCIDIRGPDGNIYVIWGIALDLSRQLGNTKEWEETLEAAKRLYNGNHSNSYLYMLNVFREFFPMVTLVGYDEVKEQYDEQIT